MPDCQSTHAASPDPTRSLTTSHVTVAFAPTRVSKPSFQLVTIAHAHVGTPVYLSISEPEMFTVAVDSHPKFVAGLVFTPSSPYSYVHIRYAPNRRGNHVGQLTIQHGDESLTIALTGRRSVALPSRRPFVEAIKRSRSERSRSRTRLKPVVGLLVAVAAGLTFLVYARQAPHSLHPQMKAKADLSGKQVARSNSVHSFGEVRMTTQQTAEASGHRAIRGDKNRSRTPDNERIQQPLSGQKRDVKSTSPVVANARQPADASTSPDSVVRETAQKQQNVFADESDLERVLNHRSRKSMP